MYGQPFRPVLKLPQTITERLWNIVGALFFIGSIGYLIFLWRDLPSEIPAHFNAAGQVDRYGSKLELLILPIIGGALWALMNLLERKPHIHNYPKRLNESNVEAFYLSSRKMLNITKNICLIIFGVISFQTIRIGLGEAESLGVWFLPLFLVGTMLPIGIGIFEQKRIQ